MFNHDTHFDEMELNMTYYRHPILTQIHFKIAMTTERNACRIRYCVKACYSLEHPFYTNKIGKQFTFTM